MELSIVIICKNDAAGMEDTLRSIAGLDADILVYDAGSTDSSKQIAINNGVRLHEGEWESYNCIRYKAAQQARHDWILMLHTGEVLDDTLKSSLTNFKMPNDRFVYKIRFKNYFGKRWLQHGEWGRYSHIRLANRKGVKTNGHKVCDEIFSQPGIATKRINGFIIHRVQRDIHSFAKKIMNDALLSAARYHREGKKANAGKLVFSPLFAFVKNYVFKLGFLDGWEGYVCAQMSALYTFLKYTRLRELNQLAKMQP